MCPASTEIVRFPALDLSLPNLAAGLGWGGTREQRALHLGNVGTWARTVGVGCSSIRGIRFILYVAGVFLTPMNSTLKNAVYNP